MIRSAASKAMWVGRTTAAVIGLAIALAVVLGVATMALAAVPGDPFKLGKVNSINKVSTLVGSVTSPLLSVDNNGGGPALRLEANSGKAPMVVNADSGTAKNLSADKVDGEDFSAFGAQKVIEEDGPLPVQGTYTSKGGTLIIEASGSAFRGTGQSLTAGRIGMHVKVDGGIRGFAYAHTNERNSHKAFVDEFIVVEGLPAGEHTIGLERIYFPDCNTSAENPFDYCTMTDFEDFFRVMVMEIPD